MDKNLKMALIIGGVVLAIVLIVPTIVGAITGWQGYGYGMMGGFGTMGLMGVFWIVVVGLIIWAVIAAGRGTSHLGGSGSGQTDSALEILKRRYARGDINKAEYEEKKKDLA